MATPAHVPPCLAYWAGNGPNVAPPLALAEPWQNQAVGEACGCALMYSISFARITSCASAALSQRCDVTNASIDCRPRPYLYRRFLKVPSSAA